MVTTNIQTSKNSPAINLAKAVVRDEKKLEAFRLNRRAMIEDYCGPYYGEPSNHKKNWRQPLNLAFSLVSTLVPHLAPDEIQGDIKAKPGTRWFAEKFRIATDRTCRKSNASRAIRMAIMDAMFGMGIVKTGLGPSSASTIQDEDGIADPGECFCECVDLDDYVVEMARSREAASFEGNRYRVPFEWAMDSDLFKGKARAKIEQLRNRKRPRENEVANLTSQKTEEDEWNPQVELMDLWIPHKRMVVTIPGDPNACDGYLREVAWEGVPSGPYDVLGYAWVNSNLMPVPLIAVVRDLIDLINRVARKIARQADRQKDIIIVDSAHKQLGDNIRKAMDGDVITGDPKGATSVSVGGPNDVLYKAVNWFMGVMNTIDGNMDLLGGLEQTSDRVGTNSMLMSQATIRVADMRNQTQTFAGAIYKKHGYYTWTDPTLKMDIVQRLPNGEDISMTDELGWNPDVRIGNFEDYEFGVKAYTAMGRSPQEQYKATMEWISQVVLPTAPMAQAQGKQIDLKKLVELPGRQLGIEMAGEVYAESPPPQPEMAMPGGGADNAPRPVQEGSEASIKPAYAPSLPKSGSTNVSIQKKEITKKVMPTEKTL